MNKYSYVDSPSEAPLGQVRHQWGTKTYKRERVTQFSDLVPTNMVPTGILFQIYWLVPTDDPVPIWIRSRGLILWAI